MKKQGEEGGIAQIRASRLVWIPCLEVCRLIDEAEGIALTHY